MWLAANIISCTLPAIPGRTEHKSIQLMVNYDFNQLNWLMCYQQPISQYTKSALMIIWFNKKGNECLPVNYPNKNCHIILIGISLLYFSQDCQLSCWLYLCQTNTFETQIEDGKTNVVFLDLGAQFHMYSLSYMPIKDTTETLIVSQLLSSTYRIMVAALY